MEIKTLKTSADLTLTYYRAGSAREFIVIANAPGMSIEFWSWIIRELQNQYVVLAFDYRGFPNAQSELTDHEVSFDDVIADLSTILAHEAVEAAHFVSWGLGGKLVFEFQQRFPEKVLSLIPISMDNDAIETNANSRFSNAVLGVKQQLDAYPETINTVTKVIRRIGAPSSINLFSTALREAYLQPVLNLIDILVMESSMSNLALHLLERPAGLKNYLKLYEAFCGFEVNAVFENIKVPVVIVGGDSDGIATISLPLRRNIESIPRIEWVTLEKASHFLPIEFPQKTANIIRDAARRANIAKVVSHSLV